MSFLPTVHDDLRAAAARQSRAMAARRRRARLSALVLLALLTLSGVAFATRALSPWQPTPAQLHGVRLTVSPLPPPASQLTRFGVLRRPQTPRDREASSLIALERSANLRGIRTGYVRLLLHRANRVFVLVPAQRLDIRVPGGYHLKVPFSARTVHNPLCLYVQDAQAPNSWTGGCRSTANLLTGGYARIGGTFYGLVPDDVRTVHVARRHAGPLDVRARDNFYAVDPRHPVRYISWLDAAGKPIGPICGAPRTVCRLLHRRIERSNPGDTLIPPAAADNRGP